jgi:hypothetical protein
MGMRTATTIVTSVFVLIATSCGRDDPAPLPDPVETGTPVEVVETPTPTVDPEAASGFTVGSATVTVTGAVNLSESYPSLGLPALWALPPGDFAMTWRGPQRELTLGGASFTAQQPTASDRVLTFTMRGPDGPLAFSSDDGGCLVTISPALPDRMGGTFLCTAITGDAGDGGTVTVSAQGTFTAE